MASVAPPADQAADLVQKMSLDSQNKTGEVPESTKKNSTIQYAPVGSSVLANGLNKPFERSMTPLPQDVMDPTMCYLPNGYPSAAYYYGGYNGSGHELGDSFRYASPDGVEMLSGVYGDPGSHMYHHGYSLAPFGTYRPPVSPLPTMGHDGQLFGPQHYQYPNSYYRTSTPHSGSVASKHAIATQASAYYSTAANQVPFPGERANFTLTNISGVNDAIMSNKLIPNYPNSSLGQNSSYGSGVQPTSTGSAGNRDQRATFSGTCSPNPWLDASVFPNRSCKHALVSHSNGRNQNLHPFPHLSGLQYPSPTSGMTKAGLVNEMCPNNKIYGPYGNTLRTGTGFGLGCYGPRVNGRACLGFDSKYRPRGSGDGSFEYVKEHLDGWNELNRGPRAKGFNNLKNLERIPLYGNDYERKSAVITNEEQYNGEDFPETYSDAKFFIIKSYSEDNVHKSIKYGVWASTPNGNKKLDASYQEAQAVAGDCPVFLFFSVNASGQFVGLAEMGGTVDFNKSKEYWQQDKWTGCFPVKWHIVKDVPNSLLKHITLEYNENKPVTNSRDTQEVKFEQGIEMLKIFKGHSSNTCILNDFWFYEARQQILQENKAKQQLNKPVVENRKPIDLTDVRGTDGSIGKEGLQS